MDDQQKKFLDKWMELDIPVMLTPFPVILTPLRDDGSENSND